MTTELFPTPTQFTLNCFYIGVTMLLIGSMARHEAQLRLVIKGTIKYPPTDGRLTKNEKLAMYPFKILGYVLMCTAICVQLIQVPGKYYLPISYTLLLLLLILIPIVFRTQKNYCQKDNCIVQRERLLAGRGAYSIISIIFPVFILGESCTIGQVILLITLLFESLIFLGRVMKIWEDYADFDIESSERLRSKRSQ